MVNYQTQERRRRRQACTGLFARLKDDYYRSWSRGRWSRNQLEEAIYEGIGPNGSSFIIVCATDNTNRTITDVKTAFKKNGGKFVPSGSVSFNYNHVGLITITPDDLNVAELDAIDVGALDVRQDEESLIITTNIADFHAVQEALIEKKYVITESKLSYEPTQTVSLDDQSFAIFETLYDIIDDLEDVQEIFTNVA